MPIRVEPKIKKKKKKVTPLGRLKKQGPKPGSFSYQQEQTLKPGYKVPPMMIGGEIRPFKDKGLERKQRPMDRIQKRDRMKQRPKKTKNKPGIAFLTGGQAKLDRNKNNKIDAQDFKILRAEKAKGRGMGLQDEKMKPGKVMKADKGKMIKGKASAAVKEFYDTVPPNKDPRMTGAKYRKYLRGLKQATAKKSMIPMDKEMRKRMAERALRAARATTIGKIALGVAAVGLGAKEYLKRRSRKKRERDAVRRLKEDAAVKKLQEGVGKVKKKMGGGMMMQRPMMARKGKLAKIAMSKGLPMPLMKYPKGFLKNIGKFPYIKPKKKMGGGLMEATQKLKAQGKMGGGMMMSPNPVGMKAGKSVKVKCKIGRNKPTKMY